MRPKLQRPAAADEDGYSPNLLKPHEGDPSPTEAATAVDPPELQAAFKIIEGVPFGVNQLPKGKSWSRWLQPSVVGAKLLAALRDLKQTGLPSGI